MPHTAILRSVLGLVSETPWLPEAEASFDLWSDGATGWSLMNGDSIPGPVEWPNTRRGRVETLVPHQARQGAAFPKLRHGNTRFDCACGGVVSDERAEARREVLAALVELARRHATQHQELHQTAVQHVRDDMAQRAYASQNTWLEVARARLLDMGRG